MTESTADYKDITATSRPAWMGYELELMEEYSSQGYTDFFKQEGRVWGFPPNGVMPVPLQQKLVDLFDVTNRDEAVQHARRILQGLL